MADAPGRQKVSMESGFNSTFPCRWCIMQGVGVPNEGGTGSTRYPAGYLQKVFIDRYALLSSHFTQRKRKRNGGIEVRVGEEDLKVSESE